MTDTSPPSPSAEPDGPTEAARADAALWQGGWALGAAAGAAAMLVVVGGMSGATMAALTLAAIPGVIGYLWRPGADSRLALLAVWAVGTGLAAAVSGGATGPLAVGCLAPLLVGALLGLLPEGAVLAGVAVLGAAALQWAGRAGAPEGGTAGVALAAIGLLGLFGATAGAVVVILRDLRRRNEGVRHEHRWFDQAVSALPHLGLALDRDGRPEAVFGAAPAALGPDWLAGGVAEAAAPDFRAPVEAALHEALEQGSAEVTFRPAGAPELILQLSLRRRDEQGLSALIREIPPPPPLPEPLAELPADARVEAAERRVAEAEAARAEAEAGAAAKSRFLANMSHELRTPLNAIMGFSDIMRARMFGELSPKYGEYAELIHESGRHLTDLINDVLDMSKIEAERYSLTLETFDARDAINAAMRLTRLQADEAGIQQRGLMPPDALTVEADRRAIKQIVLNLVSNALKFTPRGGSVTVTARARGRELELVVADTGAGIAPEDLERLGCPYEQAGDAGRRAQGTGLGLSLVKAFAGLHGGAMSIESAPGEGTAVTVRMPVIPRAAGAQAQPEPDAPPVPTSEAAAEALLETEPVDGEAVLEREIEERTGEMEPLEAEPHDVVTDAEAAAAQPDRERPQAANEGGEAPKSGGVVIHLPGARPV